MNAKEFLCVLCFLCAAVSDGLCQSRGNTKFPRVFGNSAIRRLIEINGYGYENYTVTTDDGYLLNLNRIVHPNRTNSDRGYPVLLVNGYFMHSDAWLLQYKLDSNIGFVFSDKGYDVWLGDQRGTVRSKGHINRTINYEKFWDFTYEETGVYDLPAFIDFILKKTNHDDLIFSCLSLGCTFHAVLGSKRPSYNTKIRAAIYLVPVVNNARRFDEMSSILFSLFKLASLLIELYWKAGELDWFPYLGHAKKELWYACQLVTPTMYTVISRLLFGSANHMPFEILCSTAALSLGGTNPKLSRHIYQLFENGDLAEFDYGREENMKKYGSELPPSYDMKKITSPIAIYYSDSDYLTYPKRTHNTTKSLGGPTYTCKLPNFNHLDIATGSTFRFVLPDVIELMDSFTSKSNNTGKFKSGKCPSMEWIRYLQ